MSDALKRCPFCPMPTGRIVKSGWKQSWVICLDCEATGPMAASDGSARVAWNRSASWWRPADDAKPGAYYIVWCGSGVRVARYVNGEWWDGVSERPLTDVTHIQELPD